MPDRIRFEPRLGATLLKVCGATSRADVAALASGGADLIGLWHGVSGGHADLERTRLAELAAASEAEGATPVLVTFDGDPAAVSGAMLEAGIGVVQLHGYQPPPVVRAIKAATGAATVVKVLHVDGTASHEQRLSRSYRRAGVDAFLLDAVGHDGSVGSTGRELDPAVALSVADAADAPFLLAGGISAGNAERFAAVRAHPLFLGVDVDSAARDANGRLTATRVAAIHRAWHRPQRRRVAV
ncbi:phosphoribosylanthranilate isomerase [Actinophytocola sp.]|uniref:phosphoribosylanthranilate isomerase n=1 Tax=Actinophytocola sp. TaxID=1872138 RepID=UPI003D6BB480